ncbi:DNA polymerase Y family protein [Microbacterium sp. BWT-B31]|uniref:DNA polymerase Y family protein n=1 Tax=Microbacterium sp. BWT-B31 TaxID=3232072 RepID=UPI00352829E5
MAGRAPERSLVLWFPDWPVTALLREGARDDAGEPYDPVAPIAVMHANQVVACSAAARAAGVRRGQRRRDAQARCPRLAIVPADLSRDHRAFAPVVARVEERAPGVQLVRPGLCALRARGPSRYYGGEQAAARVLLEALDALGLDEVRAGVADGPFTAQQAARAARPERVRVVPAGEAAAFLAPLSVATLDEATGLDTGATGGELAELLARLGVQTLGDFAALEADRVRERFGERGVRLHALAAGGDSSPIEPRVPPPELHREVVFEPPLEIAEQIGFAMRVPAEEFIARLGATDLVCTELRVELIGDRGEHSERVWLHPGSFDASAVVDRVRWQLAEDASAQGADPAAAGGALRSGVVLVRISPEAVDAASHHRVALFGAGPDERVHHALSRVQAMLGHRGVLTPAVGGGRWLAERQVLVPWGDRVVLGAERSRPWPGSLPPPLPTTVFPEPRPAQVSGAGGAAVAVDERGLLSTPPAVLVEGGRRRDVLSWAGPWPVIERGWDAARARRAHRFQLVDAEGTAWLVVCEAGVWSIEAKYD